MALTFLNSVGMSTSQVQEIV